MDPILKDPSFDPSAHSIISFAELLESKPEALQQIKQQFKTRGWCIIRLPDTNISKLSDGSEEYYGRSLGEHSFPVPVQHASTTLSSFFAQKENQKEQFKGYSTVPHKESIHITTPFYSSQSSPLSTLLIDLCKLWDEASVDLLRVLAENVFGCSQATLAHRADIPLAWDYHKGMLDVAHYFNNQTTIVSPDVGTSTKEVNCVPHYDPGLLSISFLSTHEGLQLKDPETDTWFAGPVNTEKGQETLGVIWLGEAAVTASKGEFKAGVHRVVYPQTPVARITAWYEVCSTSQVNREAKEVQGKLKKHGKLKLHNLPKSKPIMLAGDRSLIERYYGIPESKSGDPIENEQFRAAYSDDPHNKVQDKDEDNADEATETKTTRKRKNDA